MTSKGIALIIAIALSLLSLVASAQQGGTVISGYVIGSDGDSPLAGVVIHSKENPKEVTTTGTHGEYKMTVSPSTKTVVFEMMGYDTKEIKIEDSYLFTLVTLIVQANALEESVVVGFGTQKKESLVGAVQAVKPSELATASSNLTTAFAGNIPGLIARQTSGEPGSDGATFYIRGISTFGANSSALIVLDGVEITGSMLNNIPVEAIESMSVLKDATATALYGSRGANGVLIVTTKEGRNSEKLNISVSFDNTFSLPTMVQEIADGVQYMELYNEAVYNVARASGSQYVPFYSSEKIEGTRNNLDKYVYPNNDWYKMLFKDFAVNQRFNVSLRGGGKKVNYFLNASIYNENGIIREPKDALLDVDLSNKKFLFQSNVTAQATRTTKVSMKLNMQIQYQTSPYESTSDLFYYTMRANPVRFPATLPAQDGDTFVRYGNFDTWDTGSNDLNPYALLSRGYQEQYRSWMTASLNIDQDLRFITKGLSAKAMVSFYNYSYASTKRSHIPAYYRIAPESITLNPDGTYDWTAATIGTEGTTYLDSSVSASGYHEWSLQGQINYARKFGKHDVSADVVYHMKEKVNNATGSAEEKLLPFREQGLAGRVTYNYDKRYYVEGNFGYNGSENFVAGKRFGFFPSAAIGWNISNEKFFAPIKKVVSNLKLRASYGLAGNDALGDDNRFPYISLVNMGARAYPFGAAFTMYGAGYIESYGNPDATWEVAHKLNVGVDLQLCNEFTLAVDWFKEKRDNIFMQRESLASHSGLGTALPWANIGETSNQGVDLSANWSKVINKDLSFTLRGTFTYAHSQIVAKDEPDYSSNPHLSQVGKPIQSNKVLIAEGIFTSQEEIDNSPKQDFGTYTVGDIKYKDVNGDGVVNSNDFTWSDKPYFPEIQYGFGGNVKYRNWDLSIMFQGSGNYWITTYNNHPFCDANHFGYNIVQYIADDHWSWDNNNANAKYPRLTSTPSDNNIQASTLYLHDASFLRLKNLEIGYTYKFFRVYLQGTNLFYVSKFKYWDPEKGRGNGLSYPLQRTGRLGFQFNF
ncbi:MAG: SusC/RagA family TonB-linked outer membrane protein [Candidatus Cryptobacteroides sp.]